MQFALFGIVTGSILMVASVGFALVRQSENFFNVAHGQQALFGAWLGYVFSREVGLPIWLAAIVAILLTAVLSVVISRVIYRPVASKGPTTLLFTSIGLAFFMYGAMYALMGNKPQSYDVPMLGLHRFFGASITGLELVIIGVSFTAVGLLHLFLTKTLAGKAIRAVATNELLAQTVGIRTARTSMYVWLWAGGFAGLAGVLWVSISSLNTEVGWSQIIIVLAAAVLGGTRSIYGVMVAGLILGLAMDMSALIIPSEYRFAMAFLMTIIVLLIKPGGISGERA